MNSEIRWGVAISIACFLWQLLEFKLGFHTSRIDYYPFIIWLILIIPIAGIYWAVRFKRDRSLEGKISFIQALVTGLKITAVCAFVIPLFSWLYIAVINPLYLNAMFDHRVRLIESLNLSNMLERDLLEKEAIQEFTTLTYLSQRFLVSLISGIIISLIVAGVIQKEKTSHKSELPSDANTDQNLPSNK